MNFNLSSVLLIFSYVLCAIAGPPGIEVDTDTAEDNSVGNEGLLIGFKIFKFKLLK